MAGFGNAGAPPHVLRDCDRFRESLLGTTESEKRLWREYASSRPYVADTAAKEAAATLVRNRDAVKRDADRRKTIAPIWRNRLPNDDDGMDRAMRALASLLAEGVETDCDIHNDFAAVPGVGALASFLDERMCVPRDMGPMSAAAIKRVSFKLDNVSNLYPQS